LATLRLSAAVSRMRLSVVDMSALSVIGSPAQNCRSSPYVPGLAKIEVGQPRLSQLVTVRMPTINFYPEGFPGNRYGLVPEPARRSRRKPPVRRILGYLAADSRQHTLWF
jgi:hypothetical protein